MNNQNGSDRSFVVYVHQNCLNNKRYIGITCQKPHYRWGNGSTYKTNRHFYNAIQKDGWDNFIHEIVASNLQETEAKALEQKLIKDFNTTNSDFGYNKTIGGEGNLRYQTEAERHKALRDHKNRCQQKLRQNPEFREKERQYAKQYRIDNKDNQMLSINNPEKRKQYLAKYLSNPANKEKCSDRHKESNKKINREVCALRDRLKAIYEEHPERFSAEQVEAIYGRKNRNYIVNSKKVLNEIYESIQASLGTQPKDLIQAF
jgi:hypothetical protein